jgi:hypothetical protein
VPCQSEPLVRLASNETGNKTSANAHANAKENPTTKPTGKENQNSSLYFWEPWGNGGVSRRVASSSLERFGCGDTDLKSAMLQVGRGAWCASKAQYEKKLIVSSREGEVESQKAQEERLRVSL